MKIPVESWSGESVQEISLLPEVFSLDVRPDVIARVVRWQLAKRRQGTHGTKGISQVSGTTKKPFRQKGTGSARLGSRRAPQCRGGGVIFGPVPRDHSHFLNKKIRKLGLRMALSMKARDGHLRVLSDLDSPPVSKTKDLKVMLDQKGWGSALFVGGEKFPDLFSRCSRGIHLCDLIVLGGLNVFSILQRDFLVLCPESVNYLNKWLVS